MQQPPSQGVGGTGDPYASNPTLSPDSNKQPRPSQTSETTGTANELKADAQKLGSKAANRLYGEVDARKGTAVSQAKTVSSALERTAGELDDGAPDWLKSTIRQGAQQIQSFAESVEQKDSRQLVRDAESFARERPGMFLALCAAAGFAAARIFKAGGEQQDRFDNYSPRAPSVEPAYGSSANNGLSSSQRGELI